jgi:hypothetical protein
MSAGRAFFQSQMAAAAQEAARREAALQKRMESDRKIFEIAREYELGGDLPTASRLYRRLALRRPAADTNKSAQERLVHIQEAPFAMLQELESQLQKTKPPITKKSALLKSEPVAVDANEVTRIFAELDKLQLDYAAVATVESRLEDRIELLRKDPLFAAVLQEPAAAELWKMGQEYEKKQQACCAVQVYEQAASFLPAASAKLARTRLQALTKDPVVARDVERCRVLQLCHEKFREAEKVKGFNPDKAREHLARIIELAPQDTSIHKAAREQIALLK